MRTRKYAPEEAARVQAEADLAAWAGVGKKKRTPAMPKEKARKELAEFMLSGDYSKAKAIHFVALYEWCHVKVYGVAPSELNAAAWRSAALHAGTLMKTEFRGDPVAVVDFIRWTWKREAGRENARRSGRNANVGRVGWRLQFVARYLLTDYRIEIARGGK